MYKSKAQAAKFQELMKEGKISPKVVAEFDKASKGKKLPERITPKKVMKTTDEVRAYAKKKFGK